MALEITIPGNGFSLEIQDRKIDRRGYVQVKVKAHPYTGKQGWVSEHRLVVMIILGRPLLPDECVHHKNQDKKDNRPENLQVFSSKEEHMEEHRKLKERKNRERRETWEISRNEEISRFQSNPEELEERIQKCLNYYS